MKIERLKEIVKEEIDNHKYGGYFSYERRGN